MVSERKAGRIASIRNARVIYYAKHDETRGSKTKQVSHALLETKERCEDSKWGPS